MALSYILVQQLVPETPHGGFFVCLVGLVFFFFLVSLIWFNLLQLESPEIEKKTVNWKIRSPSEKTGMKFITEFWGRVHMQVFHSC